MSEAAADHPPAPRAPHPEQDPPSPTGARFRRRSRALASAGLITLAVLGGVWLTRERIADAVIAGQLRDLNLPATYRIEQIGPHRQVLRNIVIGDSRHPDMTIERAEIVLVPRLGLPTIGAITLVRPRVYGTWQGQRLSFGRLDPILRGGSSGKPFRLPELGLTIIDGRARLLGDHGPVGLAFAGQGGLRGGFTGTLAGISPRLRLAGCEATQASLFGQVRIVDARPSLSGPLRLGSLTCAGSSALTAEAVTIDLSATADEALDGGAGRLGLQSGPLALGPVRANGWNGTVDASYRQGNLTARYDLIGRGLAQPQAAAATVALGGLLRSRGGLGRFETEGTLDAGGLRVGKALAQQLDLFERESSGTLVAPLLRQARLAMAQQERGSRFRAGYVLRATGEDLNLVMPQGRLTGRSGATLLSLSRLRLATGAGPARLAGNFVTGGAGLPQITGRLEDGARGQTRITMRMAEYRAGDARLAVPGLTLIQHRSGALDFTGTLTASGALPGGQATNLVVPLDGARDARGTVALWRRCVPVAFDSLSFADLAFDRRSLTLCPPGGGAIVHADDRSIRLAVGTPALDLSGRLGETPVRITSGAAGFGLPGGLFVSALDVVLGPAQTASRFRVTDLRAQVGRELTGTFAGTDVRLSAVPLDLLDAAGRWRFGGGQLTIDGASFRLEDRAQVDRFQPMQGVQATLSLLNNVIKSSALIREPESSYEVARLDLTHDLSSARGHADLRVPGLVFDRNLQPDQLTAQLLGVVANVRGTVNGTGRIDWAGERVRSTGRFRTDGLDLAAAFGPAGGIKGEVVFSDLIGLVTPPHQRLTIASINPGIEVTDGEMLFQLKPGAVAAIEGARWPFLGGQLYLRPAEMKFGVEETRRFVIDIEALDAAHFVERMELANLSATGAFDGSLPLVFDQNGGRIEGGMLKARPPGGNLSYIGALTYKDLSPIANFAFDALKSLDYRTMRIAMDGALAGEIVTRVRFDGVKQGTGAKRNFITRRLGNLPLQFNVNLRAPFYSLISSVKAMYDPAYVRDPRSVGLIDAQGRAIPRGPAATRLAPRKPIQPPVSENKP